MTCERIKPGEAMQVNTTDAIGGEVPNDFRTFRNTHSDLGQAMSSTVQPQKDQSRHQPALTPSRAIDLHPLADSITSSILHCRDDLPKAANGHTIAPSNPQAAQFRKQVAGGVSDPVYQLATIAYTDIEDKVPYHVATAGITRLLTFLKVHADAIRRQAPRSIVSAFNNETRRQHATDLLEHRVILPATCDEQALVDCIAGCRQHAASLEELAVACEAELASRHCTRIYALKALQQ